MNSIPSNFMNAGGFFLFIFLSGYLLSHLGKPYNMLIITIHKLLGLAIGIYLGVSLHRSSQSAELNTLGLIVIVATIASFLVMVTSGSLLSAERAFPPAITSLHRAFPYLTVLITVILILVVF
jgi:hypothetical protein